MTCPLWAVPGQALSFLWSEPKNGGGSFASSTPKTISILGSCWSAFQPKNVAPRHPSFAPKDNLQIFAGGQAHFRRVCVLGVAMSLWQLEGCKENSTGPLLRVGTAAQGVKTTVGGLPLAALTKAAPVKVPWEIRTPMAVMRGRWRSCSQKETQARCGHWTLHIFLIRCPLPVQSREGFLGRSLLKRDEVDNGFMSPWYVINTVSNKQYNMHSCKVPS